MSESDSQLAVSYIILSAGREAALERCLDSILGTETLPFEIVVVWNGQRGAEKTDPRVRYLTVAENIGVAAGRNLGAQTALGSTLIFIDDDAFFVSQSVGVFTQALLAASAPLSVLAFLVEDPQGTPAKANIPTRWKNDLEEGQALAYFCGCGFALNKRTFDRVGGFWERLFYSGEELDFSYRLIALGGGISFTEKVRVRHLPSPQGRSADQFVFYNARNRPWVALRNLPWGFAVSTALLWWLYLAAKSLSSRKFRPLGRALRESLAALPQIWARRAPLSFSQVKRVWGQGGRLLY